MNISLQYFSLTEKHMNEIRPQDCILHEIIYILIK